ncbi:MAG TPA: glycosyltransferase family 2 protein [Saprospiraceae bacterium]|nr:glycosyltransferase family 2 protein [Saprospiraceae bacterium]HMQ85776.1 glycosyltransferase family 2 protein [Saprospiraceae bacterium]
MIQKRFKPLRISIITPTFNSGATLKTTIDSIQNQTYPHIEHIIVDGGSTDNTLDIIHAAGTKIKEFISEPDNGLYDALNKGLALATGDVIGILNSDDFYPNKRVLEKVAKTFFIHQTDSVYGDLQYVEHDNLKRVVRHWKSGKYYSNSFLYGWMPPHPTFFVRREVYQRLGLFDTQLQMAADYELMLRFLFKNRISTVYIPEVLVKMRMGGMSNRSFKARLHANGEDRLAWEINGLKPRFYTTILKPLRKVGQYRLSTIGALFGIGL